jgi:hypothetical protein
LGESPLSWRVNLRDYPPQTGQGVTKKEFFIMKNTIRLLGIVALAAIIGFTMTACKMDDEPDTPTVYKTLKFSKEQVYSQEGPDEDFEYKPFTGDVDFNYDFGYGNVTISGGKLTGNISTPLHLINGKFENELFGFSNLLLRKDFEFTGVTISDDSVGYSIFSIEKLFRENKTTGNKRTHERVMFVYVDKAVTIKGTGKTETKMADVDWILEKTETLKDLNISLAVGWNTVCYREDFSATYSEDGDSSIRTISISRKNPKSVRWVYGNSY